MNCMRLDRVQRPEPEPGGATFVADESQSASVGRNHPIAGGTRKEILKTPDNGTLGVSRKYRNTTLANATASAAAANHDTFEVDRCFAAETGGLPLSISSQASQYRATGSSDFSANICGADVAPVAVR